MKRLSIILISLIIISVAFSTFATETFARETGRFCAIIYSEFDDTEIQVDIWASGWAEAECMINSVLENFPCGDGGFKLLWRACPEPSGDKIYIENYPHCR